MAKAKITCKCEICGGTFEHVRTCVNRSDKARQILRGGR